MDTGLALSSTPRKTIGKPMLRLSIPTPNAQFAPSKSNSSVANANANASTIANDQISNVAVIDDVNCPHIVQSNATHTNNKSNQSELEKLIKSERLAQSNKDRSDGSSGSSPLANGCEKMTPSLFDTTDLIVDEDIGEADNDNVIDDGSHADGDARLPSYTKFESDFRRRFDEMNATNRFDLRMKAGKSIQCNCQQHTLKTN